MFSFGNNNKGQCGFVAEKLSMIEVPKRIENIDKMKDIAVGTDYNLCISKENKLWVFGNANKGRLGIGEDKRSYIDQGMIHPKIKKDVERISCGINHGGDHCS